MRLHALCGSTSWFGRGLRHQRMMDAHKQLHDQRGRRKACWSKPGSLSAKPSIGLGSTRPRMNALFQGSHYGLHQARPDANDHLHFDQSRSGHPRGSNGAPSPARRYGRLRQRRLYPSEARTPSTPRAKCNNSGYPLTPADCEHSYYGVGHCYRRCGGP